MSIQRKALTSRCDLKSYPLKQQISLSGALLTETAISTLEWCSSGWRGTPGKRVPKAESKIWNKERCSSGWRGRPGKSVTAESRSRVRIPLFPQRTRWLLAIDATIISVFLFLTSKEQGKSRALYPFLSGSSALKKTGSLHIFDEVWFIRIKSPRKLPANFKKLWWQPRSTTTSGQ